MTGTWREVTLRDATISLDFRRKPVKEAERLPGPYPYWGASGIVDYVNDYLFEHPSLLLSEDGENLKTRKTAIAFYVDGKYWVNNHAHVFIAAEGYDLRFLAYQLQGTSISGYLTGSTQPKLTAANAARIPIRAPRLTEQRRIAGVLGAFDDLIDSIRQEHSRLVKLAQSVLQRSARHEKTFARVGDVADVLRGLSYKGSGLADSGIPMVNMGSAENFGWLKRSGWKFYTGDFKPRHLAGARDLILVNTEQTWRQEILGWPLLVPGDVQEALFSHHTYRVAFKPGTEWMKLPLWAHLFTAEARSRIDGSVRGTTVANLPIDAVENLTFIVPGRLDPALKAAEALLELAWDSEREVENLRISRDELLPLLISGRITVDEAWEAVP